MSVQASKIASKFPLLASSTNSESARAFSYLDNAATTQKPEVVVKTIDQFYRTSNSNVHRGVYALSEQATTAFESARKTVARFLNAKTNEIIFTSGATASLNELAISLESNFSSSDTLLLSEAEHHSNLLPWLRLAERKGCRVEWINVDDVGRLDIAKTKAAFRNASVKLIAFASVSHVLGNRQDVASLLSLAREHGAISVIDATQSAARERIDVQSLKCDALVFSGHKIYAPTGVGILYANQSLQSLMQPAFVGGGMVDRITKTAPPTWRKAPWKFEAGTPPIEAAIGLAAALDFVEYENLFTHARAERLLIDQFARYLAAQPGVRLLGWASALQLETVTISKTELADHEGILSFSLDGLHPHDVAQTLADEGIAVRAGHHCAQLLTDKIAPEGCVRISLAAYNNETDLELFKTAFGKCLELRSEMNTELRSEMNAEQRSGMNAELNQGALLGSE